MQLPPLYSEDLVPSYSLPPLWDSDAVPSSEAWQQKWRPRWLHALRDNIYGAQPDGDWKLDVTPLEEPTRVTTIPALRAQWELKVSTAAGSQRARMLVFQPESDHPVGCIAGLNFKGNHTIHPDPQILESLRPGCPATQRGSMASRWPIEQIVRAGFALATVCYEDWQPDDPARRDEGLQTLFPSDESAASSARWGAIAVWAFGLSRMLEALAAVPGIDPARCGVIGHSRLGKTALWCAVNDPRARFVISNNSGCGGAALSRRQFGETVAAINTTFPHWFCPAFHAFNDRESALPVDQHHLLALVAPRPLYVASASSDLWADPKGEWLALKHAAPAWRIHGRTTPDFHHLPPAGSGTPLQLPIAHHLRPGPHDLTQWDWSCFLQWMRSETKVQPDCVTT